MIWKLEWRIAGNSLSESVDNLFKESTLQKDPFYEQFQYFFQIMRAAGRLPYMQTVSGELKCSIFSTSTLYSMCMLSALTYVTYLLASSNNLGEIMQGTYTQIIKYFLVLISVSPQLCSLVATPLHTRRIVAYVNHWRRFNVHFQNVIGSPLPYSLKRHIPVQIAVILIVMIGARIVEATFLLRNFPWYLSWLYNIIVFINVVLVMYWYNVSLYIVHSGQALIDSLIEVLKTNPSSKLLSKYRSLWLELCDLSLELPISIYVAVIYMFITAFVAFVFSCYGFFSELIEHNISNIIEFVIPLTISLLVFSGFCDGPYKVRQKLGCDVVEAVLFCKLLELKEDVRQEVDLLLDTIESNPPVISLSGLFIIGRQTLLEVASMSTTYLVVLLQFKISADTSGGLHIEQVNLTSALGKS